MNDLVTIKMDRPTSCGGCIFMAMANDEHVYAEPGVGRLCPFKITDEITI